MNRYQVPEMAKKYINYDMISTHTELPEYSHHRARLLYAFLNKSKLFHKHSELYTLVTSLVQLGLDTHEQVDVEADTYEEKKLRSKQLKVLAGDYFSSRFYQLLSQAGQIDIIRKLSRAICEVNRIKVNLYMKMRQVKLTAEEYLHQSVEMNAKLFLCFSHCMDEFHQKAWPDFLYRFTECELLLEELKRMNKTELFPHSLAYWYLLQEADQQERHIIKDSSKNELVLQRMLEKYNIREKLQQLFQTQMDELQKRITRFESNIGAVELKSLRESLFHAFTSIKLLKEV